MRSSLFPDGVIFIDEVNETPTWEELLQNEKDKQQKIPDECIRVI